MLFNLFVLSFSSDITVIFYAYPNFIYLISIFNRLIYLERLKFSTSISS